MKTKNKKIAKKKNVEVIIDGILYDTIIDNKGVQRFPKNNLYRHLVDSRQVKLSSLYKDYEEGKFSLEQYMEFYRGLGYSLCGYLDIFGNKIKER